MKKKYFCLTFTLFCHVAIIHAQYKSILVLSDNTQTGTTTNNVACKEVILDPGYHYKPSQGISMHAHVDENLVCEVPYVKETGSGSSSGNNNSGGNNGNEESITAFSNSLEVGTTQGQFSVLPSGTANYMIPLIVPPGTAGMVPHLALNYNSSSGNGLLGMGWSLSGLSAITRTGSTVYYDNTTAPVALTINDNYLLDGQRLILKVPGVSSDDQDSETSLDGATFGIENENFEQVTSHLASAGSGSGLIDHFTAQTKDGTILEYGNTDDSRIEAQGSSSVLTWLLDKVTDVNGNYMTITYHEDNTNGEYWPESIKYTGNLGTSTGVSVSPYNEVRFIYDTRDDIQTNYVAGSKEQQSVLLTSIEMYAQNQKVHEYDLNYEIDDLYSQLVEVVEAGTDGKTYNTTKFTWHNNLQQPVSQAAITGMANDGINSDFAIITGDYNGDGYTDIAKVETTNPKGQEFLGVAYTVYLNIPGTNSFSNGGISPIANTGGYIGNVTSPSDGRLYSSVVNSLDIDGDGHDDVVLSTPVADPNSSSLAFFYNYQVYTSANGGTLNNVYTFTMPFSLILEPFKTISGDFDGDGIADLLACFPEENTYFLLSVKNGVATTTQVNLTLQLDVNNPNDNNHISIQYTAIDINGDGRSELLVADFNYVYIFNINADGNVLNLSTTTYTGFGDVMQPNYYSIFPGDYNGDGKTDVLVHNNFGTAANNWAIGYSNGSNGFDMYSAASIIAEKGAPLGFQYRDSHDNPYLNTNETAHEYFVGDFNGDGKADIIDRNYTYVGNASSINVPMNPIVENYPTSISYFSVNALSINAYFGNGSGGINNFFAANYSTTLQPQSIGNDNPTYLGDFNGDGHTDLVNYASFEGQNDQLFTFDLNNQADNGINKIVSITNGLNANTNI